MSTSSCLVLRLAGPIQSWGGPSMFNRRETSPEPTKSGLVGLLAAAQGRRRADPIEDLLALTFGVRTDQAGTLLRDYHTVSDYRGRPLPSAAVTAKGKQKLTAPAKLTHVTERFYLQDAVFIVAIVAPDDVLVALADAIRNPAFPLALGRRACPPTQPVLLTPVGQPGLTAWTGGLLDVLGQVPWYGGHSQRRQLERLKSPPRHLDLPVTLDDPAGDDIRMDLPTSFDPRDRSFTSRRVRQTWVRVPSPHVDNPDAVDAADSHDPFAILGW
ncbi:type I-E CRISPR-associated protein Cas5/CasD [Frankia sp. CiP3]|uniref:type I-E CRISPR-associated protein Cas5/CasD n=1 Tax=Frankia sp. CiP3 TaxID=2880971 RepID=UPI001EF401A4|nr:type I-E CRISPR-associated protein Cas5/CasD [Frankia sp. CiP3]